MSLFGNVNLPGVQTGGAFNGLNGSDAESIAAAWLIVACRGEVSWSSRTEDGSKIDLLVSARHPWMLGERMIFRVQVKSGKTYGATNSKGGWTATDACVRESRRQSVSTCVVWVDSVHGDVYWTLVHPNTLPGKKILGKSSRVSPATLYDIARGISKSYSSKHGAKLTIRMPAYASGNLAAAGKKFRAIDTVPSPALGDIELSRLGWRHMTRASRKRKYKENSLVLVPYLEKILSRNPTEQWVVSSEEIQKGAIVTRRQVHINKYENFSFNLPGHTDAVNGYVVAKSIEEIRYPAKWMASPALSQLCQRRVVLQSVYGKYSI